MPAAKNEDRSCCCKLHHGYSSCSQWFHKLFLKVFGGLGGSIASYPWVTVVICLAIVGACGSGFYKLKVENRTERLFVPQDSQAMKDLKKAKEFYPSVNARDEFVIFIPKNGGNILKKDCLQDVIYVHQEIINITGYLEFCQPRFSVKSKVLHWRSCIINNPLEMFNYDSKNLDDIPLTLTRTYENMTLLLQNDRPAQFSFNFMLSNLKTNQTTKQFESAETIQVRYLMRNLSDETENEDVMKWEKELIDKLQSLQDKLTCTKVFFSAERSLDDAIAESSGSDISLISITFTLMITFTCVMLGKFLNPLTGHSNLALVGVLSVGFGILGGFGLTMFIGLPFISIVGVLPFLILGIGIDDMFIIVDEMDRQDNNLTVVETVKLVMSKTGATVTMTTMTDLVAFAVSTSTDFPSVKYFCTYAAISITFSYLMIVTFFVAFVAFDVRRIKANRRDFLPICLAPPPKDGHPSWDEPIPQSSHKVMKRWARFLMLKPVRVLVVCLSLGLLAAGIYGTLNISERFDRKVLAKDGSYFKEFIVMQEKHYDGGLSVAIIIEDKPKYETQEIQNQVMKLSNISSENEFYKDTSISWMISFKDFASRANLTSTGADFFLSLNTFLNDPVYSHFKQDIIFSSDNKSIQSSQITCFSKPTTDSMVQKDLMISIRKNLKDKSNLRTYPITKSFIYFEQYAIIGKSTFQNLIIAALAVLLITWPFLLSIVVTLLVFLSFVSLVVELFALMYVWNVSLNSVSMINLVMAIGFSVDYSAHIAHAFVTSSEVTPEERVEHALSTLGASVIMGGTSTFLGMVVTGFAKSEIFRIFFKMFLGIVVLGLLHGLCFLPVYMSLICRWRTNLNKVEVPSDQDPNSVNKHELRDVSGQENQAFN